MRRPVATSMFFLAISLLGLFSWFRIPVELVPALSGDKLLVNFYRPLSEPEVVEREMVLPFESRVSQLPNVAKTWGEIIGSNASLNIEFNSVSNFRIRELELSRIAADLARTQPKGSDIRVWSQDNSALSQFVMSIQILGNEDSNALRDFVEQQIQPSLESLSGVSQVFIFGGASREVSILLDLDRCAELGVTVASIPEKLQKAVQGLHYLGSSREDNRRLAILLDNRPKLLEELGKIRLDPGSPVQLGHIAKIEMATAKQKSVSRINAKNSVSLAVFQDQGTNLVELGNQLRKKIESLQQQVSPYGVDMLISFDAADTVEVHITRLKKLALAGFFIALIVLYLFLKQIRAIAVVAISVPVSLLTAGAMLYLTGYSLNVITLFGLVVGVGMLVDNSIVVYEAVQRNMERGLSPSDAARMGIRRTVRAIITASVCNAVVFLPLIYLDEIPLNIRQLLHNVVPAILYPLTASLLVAIGLVPMLAQRFAAPAAQLNAQQEQQRAAKDDRPLPPLSRELFTAVLKVALRRPLPWLMFIVVSIMLTLIVAMPWVLVRSISQPAAEAKELRFNVEIVEGASLDSTALVFDRIEHAALAIEGVKRVESNYQEDQGSVTVHLKARDERPKALTAAYVRKVVRDSVRDRQDVRLDTLSSVQDASMQGLQAKSQIAISGPDMGQLKQIGEEIKRRLDKITEIHGVNFSNFEGPDQFEIQANPFALDNYKINLREAFDSLTSLGREGRRLDTGFELRDGREIPIMLRRVESKELNLKHQIDNLPTNTGNTVLTLDELVSVTRENSPITISYYNGRRELRINYQLSENAPKTGPERNALDLQISEIVKTTYKPQGYALEIIGENETTKWFNLVALPILLLLYAVLAIAFESLTLPLLILLAVPLTIVGSVWGLFISGMGIDMMAFFGIVVLLGLTVNPAILLVDRMQQKLRSSHCSSGAAAMTAVRERVRPVLMTACTSIVGLWPLALVHGEELEIWPSFATVVMGGLVTSTLLTLLVIPVGFIAFAKIDKILARTGIWLLFLWLIISACIITPFILSNILVSTVNVLIFSALVAGLVLWLILRMSQSDIPIDIANIGQSIEARYLSKIYGRPGPIGLALRKYKFNSRQHLLLDPQKLQQRTIAFCLLFLGSIYLFINMKTGFWQVIFIYISATFLYHTVINSYYFSRNLFDAKVPAQRVGGVKESSFEKLFVRFYPWLILVFIINYFFVVPRLYHESQNLPMIIVGFLVVVTLLYQLAQSNTSAQSALTTHRLNLRGKWQNFCKRFSLISEEEFVALDSIHFYAQTGMIGILGPNGAGKTTMLRLLTGIIKPTSGTIHYGNIEKRNLGNKLAKLIGFLPQEFGLPKHLSGREYLNYFALLYEFYDVQHRQQHIEQLLVKVGLLEKQHDAIGSYSGGMRQRIAIARTLLHEPRIIVVDEPTVGLDPQERIRLRNLLKELSKNRVVLFSTHVVEDVAVACDRVLVLQKGKIAYDGSPASLAQKAHNKVWQVELSESEIKHHAHKFRLINQTPTFEDKVIVRVLAELQPHDQAELVEVTLEDGYMQLLYGTEREQ